jgi:hypothetical protein
MLAHHPHRRNHARTVRSGLRPLPRFNGNFAVLKNNDLCEGRRFVRFQQPVVAVVSAIQCDPAHRPLAEKYFLGRIACQCDARNHRMLTQPQAGDERRISSCRRFRIHRLRLAGCSRGRPAPGGAGTSRSARRWRKAGRARIPSRARTRFFARARSLRRGQLRRSDAFAFLQRSSRLGWVDFEVALILLRCASSFSRRRDS